MLNSVLDRTFPLIVFDWDGTAVVSRHADASAVRSVVDRLLRAGVLVVVVTGTNVHNVDAQLSARLYGPHRANLFLCTNRGSEVYGFDGSSPPVLRFARQATPEEDAKLTAIADSVRDELQSRTGLPIEVVADRLNRRKIDLIPTPEWRDPPKSAIPALLAAVESRLTGAGLAGGLREAFGMTERACIEHGLFDARVTSDVKHIEVGLTDKADSVRWVLRELAAPRRIPPEDMLVGGDEFGPIAGFPGSDDRMVVPEARGAAFVSVGPEPGGVPPPVIHLGGGPPRFVELLAAQAARHPVQPLATPTRDPAWILTEGAFVPSREHEIESVFAIGNGHIGSRGSLAEGSPLSAPATYVAGLFDTAPGTTMPQLVALPDWAHVEGTIDGERLALGEGEALAHRRVLDMRQGMLWREWRHRDVEGRVSTIQALRFASLADRHILVQSIVLTPENYAGMVAVRGAPPLAPFRTGRGVSVGFGVSSTVETPSTVLKLPADFALPVDLGSTYRLDRVLDVETAPDGVSPHEIATRQLHEVLDARGIDGIVEAHRRAWDDVWRRSDVRIEGDTDAQRALRFAVYHLVSTADPDDDRVAVGARALTGPGYGGHVFWDADVYVQPFLTLTWPAAARAQLVYRHRTLPAARAKASALGYRGALYAWESAETGEEVTPSAFVDVDGGVVPVASGSREQHISADVAWAVWGYWQATADEAFLLDAGAEIVLETARFWASRARRGGADGAFHIEGVEGPDEYHDLVDDDAYTNGMARWNLERGAEIARLLARRWPEAWQALSTRLALSPDEPDRWLDVAAHMYTGLDPRTGLIEQFRGYYLLDRLDLTPYARRRTPMTVLLGRERIERSQIVKQPDVLMLLYLLWDRFPAAVREANFRFYDARTDHGSSLSPPVHAAFAARLGDVALAERYFRQTAAIDLDNDMGNAASGVHIGALGGLWQAAVLGFAGLELGPRGPTLHPHLPPTWRRLSFSILWRGQRHELCATHGSSAAPVLRAGAEAP